MNIKDRKDLNKVPLSLTNDNRVNGQRYQSGPSTQTNVNGGFSSINS